MSEDNRRVVELRCPNGPKALLCKTIMFGDPIKYTDDNLIELNCRDCTKQLKRDRPEVKRVVHRYNIIGELVETVFQRF